MSVFVKKIKNIWHKCVQKTKSDESKIFEKWLNCFREAIKKNIRNYDIYLRRVGKRLICHNSKTMNLSVNN